ncbi:MAG: hypothetical protein LBU11_10590 [Zoogloeaceae bacterium]|nr:hypothetical protein [Zoogloeaceae bacterium]
MLNNTLESPQINIPELPLLYQPIGLEHKRARRVKDTVPMLVVIGNPPYDRHEAATPENQAMTGGWVRWGETKDGSDAILEDFIAPVKRPTRAGNSRICTTCTCISGAGRCGRRSSTIWRAAPVW